MAPKPQSSAPNSSPFSAECPRPPTYVEVVTKAVLPCRERSYYSMRTFVALAAISVGLFVNYLPPNGGLTHPYPGIARPDSFLPDPAWLPTPQNYGGFWTISVAATLFCFWGSFVSAPSFKTLRLGWTIISVMLFVKKVSRVLHTLLTSLSVPSH